MKPTFHSNDIECPTCHTFDIVRMGSRVNETQCESVIWCANGHITFLDRHDRSTLLTDTHDTKNIIKMVRKEG